MRRSQRPRNSEETPELIQERVTIEESVTSGETNEMSERRPDEKGVPEAAAEKIVLSETVTEKKAVRETSAEKKAVPGKNVATIEAVAASGEAAAGAVTLEVPGVTDEGARARKGSRTSQDTFTWSSRNP